MPEIVQRKMEIKKVMMVMEGRINSKGTRAIRVALERGSGSLYPPKKESLSRRLMRGRLIIGVPSAGSGI